MKKTLWALLLILAAAFSNAQESFLRHYSISQGLPSSETYQAFQDKKGYIWIASDMGVSRFDGYNFKVFTTADGLTDNTVFKFYQDDKERIWFYTFSGRICYYLNDTIYGKDFKINDRVRDFLGSGIITSMSVDSLDTLTMSSTKGIFRLIPTIESGRRVWNKMEVINAKRSYLVNGGYATVETSGTYESVITVHASRWKATPFRIKQAAASLNYIGMDNTGRLLLYYNSNTTVVDTAYKMSDLKNISGVINVYNDKDSFSWVSAMHHGVKLYRNDDFSKPVRNFLHSLSVTSVLKDRENGYWFTTLENGVFYLASNAFTYFPPVEDQLIYNETSLCVAGKDKVWVITLKKIYSSSGLDSFRTVLGNLNIHKEVPWQLGYWNASVHSDGNIWVSVNCGIIVLDGRNANFLKLIDLPHQLDLSSDSRKVIEDHNKDIWTLNQTSFGKINHTSLQPLNNILLPSRGETICEDYEGHILIGTTNGLYKWMNDSLYYLGQKLPVFRNRFVDVKRCEGNIVGATRGAGLFILNGDSTYQITVKNGMSSNMCRSVFVDDQNVIWVATNNGLNSVKITNHPFKAEISSFTTSDGLLSDDISQVVKTGGIVWLLTKNGITAFDPDQAIVNKTAPPIYITGLKTDNEVRALEQNTELSYSTNFIAIDFVGLTWKNAGRQRSKYKLEGYDTQWAFTKNTSVQFTKLPPGSYRFLVSCINNSGVESSVPAVFAFTVNTPFYKKRWFDFTVSFFSILLVILFSFLRVRSIRKREQLKTETNRKIANLELQALRAQMNPHFIFNCLNAIQDFILKNEADAAKHYLTSFSKLIRKTLDNSRRQNIALTDEIEFLKLYLELEKMRFTDKFSYHIVVDESIKNRSVEIPSMILQPFIENAVRHSKIGSLDFQGELIIKFSLVENEICCVIEDNGIGFKESLRIKSREKELRQSYALEIMNERVRTINEVHNTHIRYSIIDKSDEKKNETGTRVVIYIPIEPLN